MSKTPFDIAVTNLGNGDFNEILKALYDMFQQISTMREHELVAAYQTAKACVKINPELSQNLLFQEVKEAMICQMHNLCDSDLSDLRNTGRLRHRFLSIL